jgi:potassium-transporting ATPase KdpC subunit
MWTTTLRMMALLTVLCGAVYPLLMTGVARVLFPHQAQGSLIVRDGRVLGSTLIGQAFEDPRYFWPRLSSTPDFPYNAALSTGSNLGPRNPARQKAREKRLEHFRAWDPGYQASPPEDLLTASASGLDPHITPEAALYQVSRVARLRGLDPNKVEDLVRRHIITRQFGILGEPVVNVLLLNQDLDRY